MCISTCVNRSPLYNSQFFGSQGRPLETGSTVLLFTAAEGLIDAGVVVKLLLLLCCLLQVGAHGKPVVFLHPKDCGGVLVELEEA